MRLSRLGFFISLVFMLAVQPLSAETAVPKWALEALAEAGKESDPKNVDAWVLLDRTEFVCTSTGEIKKHYFRLVKVFTEQGARNEAVFAVRGLGGKASKVTSLEGWNFRPGGKPLQVKRENALVLDPDEQDSFTSGILTAVTLPEVVPGSLVAFESQEIIASPLGPVAIATIAGRNPVLRWELEADKTWWASRKIQAEITPWNIEPWTSETRLEPGRSLVVRHIPGVDPDQRGLPGRFRFMPSAFLRFSVSEFPASFSANWNELGTWYHNVFSQVMGVLPPMDLKGQSVVEKMSSVQNWMKQQLHYEQVYLSENRGWVPLPSKETFRTRSGDCKDLAAFGISAFEQVGLKAYPTLARLNDGPIQGQEPVHPYVFNHVMLAIALPESSGLPAEIRIGTEHFLLLDPTDKLTPIGFLGNQHRGARVLICRPEGGTWVSVPALGIFDQRVDVTLEASVDPDGRVLGRLTLLEKGNALGLAEALMQDGRKGLERRLVPRLVINPSCSFAILHASDPMDGSGAITVEVEVNLDGGWHEGESLGTLAMIGVPPAYRYIQRPGAPPRKLPVELERVGPWNWTAKLRMPGPWSAVLPARELRTSLRAVKWNATAEGEVVTLKLESNLNGGSWGWKDASEGLESVDEDHASYSAFLSTCSEFKKRPPNRP
jgi:hypothetical protein